ncbi:hypothetical protein KSZ_11310 [Dictyobacter formicarum]|uniref:Uncharacterized protein n=2 Tax=Dictyobacter formicarum TaxID=2778368 RepID=A0ABQ3VAZ6_9CHLR|nr:hypothetical protein KSZ_11310 [Dictyobacter formicarum]
MLMIIALVFFGLLFVLAVGLLIFRRMLLPPIKVKTPSSGASSWTRTLAPDSFTGLEGINGIQEAQPTGSAFPPLATMDNDAATLANIVPSSQHFPPDTAGVTSANAETALDLRANHDTTSPWYDIADEPFTT